MTPEELERDLAPRVRRLEDAADMVREALERTTEQVTAIAEVADRLSARLAKLEAALSRAPVH